MTMFLAPYTAIADIDGSPLDAGFLFFGEYGKDPELFPVEVFWDADFTVPATQPIRTRNGYPVRNGSPTKVYLKTAQHSIVIKNRNGAFILVDFENKGWDASFVIDGDKTQKQINNIALDPNLAPLGWTQKDFNDGVIDVRKFIKKDLSNVTSGLQAAIEEAYGRTLLIPIPLKVLDTIYVNKGLKIKGTQSSAYRYATDVPLLDFTLLSSGKHAIYVSENSDVIGFGLENVYMVGGNNGGVGLKIGADIEKYCADYSIDKALIRNFSTGIEQAFAWDGSFKSVRVQGCRDGIKHSNQANAILYSQCAVVGSSNLALQFINAEGVQFDACDISNCTKTDGAPITLYQSSVMFNTPYFENIDNLSGVIEVGSQAETFGSKLIINAPFKLGKDILVGGDQAYVEINGHDRDNVGVVGASLNRLCRSKVTQSQTEKVKKVLAHWNAKLNPNFTNYTGSPTVISDRNFVTLSSVTNAGYNISASLEVGKLYTFAYSIRKTATTTEVAIRHPSTSLNLQTDAIGATPTIRYISFRAASQNLNLTFIGDVELYGFSVIEGNLDSFPNDPFLQADFDRIVQVARNAIPTEGTWKVGDIITNTTPTTHLGWVCTAAGTPGTWKQYGAIV